MNLEALWAVHSLDQQMRNVVFLVWGKENWKLVEVGMAGPLPKDGKPVVEHFKTTMSRVLDK